MRKHLIAFVALATTALSALAANPMVEMKTNQGEIVVEVFADKAPKSAENFVQYVKDGHYNGTVFHRVIDGLRGSRIVADAGPAREGVHFIGQAVLRVVQLAFQITGPLGEHVDVVGESLGAEKRLQQ